MDKEWEKLEKIPAQQLTKVRNINEVIAEARHKGKTVNIASLMDLCHLKNSELDPKFQKYKGRFVLRGDIVKDDSGSYAVFTEQGSSAPPMTAAKVMDVIARLSGCAGKAADGISAYTQSKMEDAPHCWEFQSQNVQIFAYVYQNTNGQIVVQHGRSSLSSWAKSVRSSFTRTFMGKEIQESSFRTRLGESSTLGMLIRTPWKKGYS